MSLISLVAVGCGGALGALSRCILGTAIQNRLLSSFPWGTLIVNVLSCFFAGCFLWLSLDNLFGLMATMGFLGGFSTLSTVNFESVEFAFHGHTVKGVVNMATTYICAFASASLGFLVMSMLA